MVEGVKHTDNEVLQAVQVIMEHCSYYKISDQFRKDGYTGGAICNHCVLGKKEVRSTYRDAKHQEHTRIEREAECLLQDRYRRANPWCWQVEEIESNCEEAQKLREKEQEWTKNANARWSRRFNADKKQEELTLFEELDSYEFERWR